MNVENVRLFFDEVHELGQSVIQSLRFATTVQMDGIGGVREELGLLFEIMELSGDGGPVTKLC